jgi:hypothetical protein
MKSYILLAIASIILLILASSTAIVAVGLLCKETWSGAVDVYSVVHQGAIALIGWFEFCRYSGAF